MKLELHLILYPSSRYMKCQVKTQQDGKGEHPEMIVFDSRNFKPIPFALMSDHCIPKWECVESQISQTKMLKSIKEETRWFLLNKHSNLEWILDSNLICYKHKHTLLGLWLNNKSLNSDLSRLIAVGGWLFPFEYTNICACCIKSLEPACNKFSG